MKHISPLNFFGLIILLLFLSVKPSVSSHAQNIIASVEYRTPPPVEKDKQKNKVRKSGLKKKKNKNKLRIKILKTDQVQSNKKTTGTVLLYLSLFFFVGALTLFISGASMGTWNLLVLGLFALLSLFIALVFFILGMILISPSKEERKRKRKEQEKKKKERKEKDEGNKQTEEEVIETEEKEKEINEVKQKVREKIREVRKKKSGIISIVISGVCALAATILLIITLGVLPTVGIASSFAILAAITGGLTLFCILLFLLFFFLGIKPFRSKKNAENKDVN
jgi:ABC-type multidrug transport system fused ATPase/permease subunit